MDLMLPEGHGFQITNGPCVAAGKDTRMDCGMADYPRPWKHLSQTRQSSWLVVARRLPRRGIP
eukprot:5090799-Alexandrium_andersonii.AAC.1